MSAQAGKFLVLVPEQLISNGFKVKCSAFGIFRKKVIDPLSWKNFAAEKAFLLPLIIFISAPSWFVYILF
jgi:hypothetical protein